MKNTVQALYEFIKFMCAFIVRYVYKYFVVLLLLELYCKNTVVYLYRVVGCG